MATLRAAAMRINSPDADGFLLAALILLACNPSDATSEHARFWHLYKGLLPSVDEQGSLFLQNRWELGWLQVRCA